MVLQLLEILFQGHQAHHHQAQIGQYGHQKPHHHSFHCKAVGCHQLNHTKHDPVLPPAHHQLHQLFHIQFILPQAHHHTAIKFQKLLSHQLFQDIAAAHQHQIHIILAQLIAILSLYITHHAPHHHHILHHQLHHQPTTKTSTNCHHQPCSIASIQAA